MNNIYVELEQKCRNWLLPAPERADSWDSSIRKLYDLICFLEGRIKELESGRAD
jgi:hypothetical protein